MDGNVALVSHEPSLYDAVLIAFAVREQGLLLAEGNPLNLASIAAAVVGGARFAVRPEGAGAQQLLHALLQREGLDPSRLVRAPGICPTGPDIAQAIRGRHADCGVASRSVAVTHGLEFLPLKLERFDLLMRQRDYFRAPMQALLGLLRQARFAARARELGGLDVRDAGVIRWTP